MDTVRGSWVFAAMIGIAVGGGVGAGIGIHRAATDSASAPQDAAAQAEWPDNLVGILPEPGLAQAPVASHKTLASGEVWYAGVSRSDARAYARILREAGYDVNPREGDFGNMYCYAASDAEEGGHALVVDYDDDMDFLKVKVSWEYTESDAGASVGKDADGS